MELFGRLQAMARVASAGQVPAEVYATLVDDVYSAPLSFVIGAGTASLVGAIAAWRTGSVCLAALTVATAAIAAGRLLLIMTYRRYRAAVRTDAAALRRWERWYASGALAYGACIGATCFVAFAFFDDPISHLILNSNAVGFAAGTTARNSSRPWIAVTQTSFILLPVTLGFALRLDPVYAVLSVIMFLYYVAMIEIAQYLAGNRLRLLLITREKGELAHSLAGQNVRFDAALNNMAQGLCMFDADRRLVISNRRFSEIFAIPPGKLAPGTPIEAVMALARATDANPAAAATSQYKLLAEASTAPTITTLTDGRVISISHRPVEDGGLVATFDDITGQRQAEARARFLATHDDLTRLPNRLVFGQAVGEAVKAGQHSGQLFAVMFIDLDRFKLINDTLGHAAGDILLVEIARRLRECVRNSDLVARIGGDEFVILLRDVSDVREVTTVARKILSAVVKPVTIHGQECRITASIGISQFPTDAQDEVSLSKNADAAMYVAKEEGRNNFVFHSDRIKIQTVERLMLETSLRRAVERSELVLHYQPKRNLNRGDISGVEALLRWQHPDLGLLRPNRFIPLAEETGLIVPIGKWVLETACAQNMSWQRQGLLPIRIAVNLSPRQFADPRLVADIRAALEKSAMPPELLELEITETMVMQHPERTMQILGSIKQLGITLSIDDFGTGYSSMSLVKRLPIDALKIDRAFVREIASDPDDKAIAEAIIALAHALDLTVVAEGVETAEQEAVLRAQNCDEIQGYLVCQPVPAEEFAAFLASHHLQQLKAVAVAPPRNIRPTGTQG
jgi:diguanylate cyclase (GGDEF)-like protein